MGNSSSSEAPRKAPQKLSKPRPPSHVSASDFLSPSSLSASSGDRYCESYLAGSRPVLSSVEDFPALAHDSDVAYKDVFSNSQGALSGSRPHSEVTDVGSSTQLHEPQSRQRGQSSGVARSDTARWPERPKSVVYDSGPAQPVARALSLHSNRRQSQRVRSSPDPLPPGALHVVHLQSKALQNTQSAVSVATCESVPSQDALRRSPHPDDHDDGETPRREQAALPSIPVRRRSLIQTPGVATRLVRESPRVLAKTKLERRHTTIEGETLHVPAPRAEKYLSMTACVLDVEPRERAVTPCEADYQQLGGMKFGTLRITNGSPAITPASEPLEKEIVRGVPPTTWELAESSEPSWPLRGLAAPLNANIQQAMGTKASDDYAGNITPATALTSHPVEKFETAAQRREPSKPRVDDMAQPTPAQYLENQEVDASAPTSTPNDMDYLSPEVFDVRVDPNAKSSGRPPLPVPEKDGRGSVARSDSGFVSASTSSSSSSRAALSKADSGYSSSFSLRSFRSTKSQGRDTTHSASPNSPVSPKAGSMRSLTERSKRPSLISSRGSFNLVSRDRIRRLSKADKSQEIRPNSHQTSHSRSASTEVATALFEARLENRQHLRHRSSHSRAQSVVTAYMSHDTYDSIPAVPTDIEERLHEHNGLFPTASKRIALRVESSQETLRTIVSMDSMCLGEPTAPASQSADESMPAPISQPEEPRLNTGPNLLCAPTHSIRRKPVGTGIKHAATTVVDASRSRSGQNSAGHRWHDGGRGSTGKPLSQAYSAAANGSWSTTKPSQPTSSTQAHSLSSRASAPDLPAAGAWPLAPSRSRAHNGKNSPPISLHSGTFRSSQPPPSLRLSHPKSTPSLAHTNRQTSDRRPGKYTAQGGDRQDALGLTQEQTRHSPSGTRRQPPQVYRESLTRHRSGSAPRYDDHGQQYRILHSYNSPAYKNSPIWG